jgi:protein-cysteine N-palmitoyltransferase HHAT
MASSLSLFASWWAHLSGACYLASLSAFWHDRTVKLFVWGILICLFIIPELILRHFHRKLFPSLSLQHPFAFRMIKGFFAALNVYLMAIANILGFVLADISEMTLFLVKIFTPSVSNITSFLITFICIFAMVQIMFEIRAEENRQGIHKKF